MRSSYRKEDVTLLLKDITGLIQPQSTQERERLIQSGKHYSEMLPIEYVPTQKYMEVYKEALETYAGPTAKAVQTLSDKIMQTKGKDVVLVSLARAGIPIGILVKHYIRKKYALEVPHYAISIIKGRGIDDNAMNYLLERYQPGQLLFLDGWIGKGAILEELRRDIEAYEGVSSDIAVLADPANVTALCGTHDDILIPSSCLNCTVSGLVSRTVLREDLIGPDDFHGAVYYGELADSDLSYEFIDAIERHFEMDDALKEGSPLQEVSVGKKAVAHETDEDQEHEKAAIGHETDEVWSLEKKAVAHETDKVQEHEKAAIAYETDEEQAYEKAALGRGIDEVRALAEVFGVEDINLIKPGIGETTRVLLRRVPWKVLIDEKYQQSPALGPVVRLAEEKNVPIVYYPLKHYKCCGIIKKLAET